MRRIVVKRKQPKNKNPAEFNHPTEFYFKNKHQGIISARTSSTASHRASEFVPKV
jgi:hypothetical protein